MRSLFKILRLIPGPFMLLWEFVTTPHGLLRGVVHQQAINARCRRMVLYQYRTCPNCIRTRHEIRRLSLPIELRDPRKPAHRAELPAGSGPLKVPCLKITDPEGRDKWLYDSREIIAFLKAEFGPVSAGSGRAARRR